MSESLGRCSVAQIRFSWIRVSTQKPVWGGLSQGVIPANQTKRRPVREPVRQKGFYNFSEFRRVFLEQQGELTKIGDFHELGGFK